MELVLWCVLVVVLLAAAAFHWHTTRRFQAAQAALKQSHTESLVVQDGHHKDHIRRLKRESQQQISRGNHSFAEAMLAGLDALHQAIDTLPHEETEAGALSPLSEAAPEWHKGLLLVEQQLWQAMQSQGYTPITPRAGDAFDPQYHESIGLLPTDEVPPGHVARTLRIGWNHQANLLRPALVSLASAPLSSSSQMEAPAASEAPPLLFSDEEQDEPPESVMTNNEETNH